MSLLTNNIKIDFSFSNEHNIKRNGYFRIKFIQRAS